VALDQVVVLVLLVIIQGRPVVLVVEPVVLILLVLLLEQVDAVRHVKVMMVVVEQVLLVLVQELEAEAVEQLLSVYQVPHPHQMLLKVMVVLAQLVIFQAHV
jgi:hypothetical protein